MDNMDIPKFKKQKNNPEKIYRQNVRIFCYYRQKLKKDIYALIDHDNDGSPLVKPLRFVMITREGGSLICHCGTANCLHLQEAINIWQNDTTTDSNSAYATVWKQCEDLHLIGVYSEKNKTYSVVTKSLPGNTITCLTCKHPNTRCCHVKAYREMYPTVYTSPEFICISSDKIPYRMEGDDKLKYLEPPPRHLIPKYSPTKECDHGNKYDHHCPYTNKWTISSRHKPQIHDARQSIICTVYYRPTIGACECQQSYDGRHDLLLNLDNSNFFTYAWLFDYMHFTQETRLPLAAFFRAVNRSRENGPGDLLKSYMEDKLRLAYNCFIRLLDLDFLDLYKCRVCKDNVKEIVIDGIQMGCLHGKMPPKPAGPGNRPIINEVNSQRVYVKTPETRTMLAKYAGYSKGEYKPPSELSVLEFKVLLMRLKLEAPRLRKVIKKAGPTCPRRIQKVLGELSRGNPTCGIFQIAGDIGEVSKANQVLREIAKGDYTLLNSSIDLLDKTCPLFIELIQEGQERNEHVLKLLNDILDHIQAPYKADFPQEQHYESPAAYDELLEKFPNFPQIRGKGNYGADKNRQDTSVDCNKATKRTPNLTSGIFTFFCPHGICLGFQLMDAPESPRVPFDILVRRFPTIPRVIIYDNSCNLHLYSLKREPKRFMNTRFMVDRMHRKNHVCTEGYSMETYSKDSEIKNLNSQACEQANSQLRRLGTQLAYMTPENAIFHVKVFLAVRNRDKLRKLDLFALEPAEN